MSFVKDLYNHRPTAMDFTIASLLGMDIPKIFFAPRPKGSIHSQRSLAKNISDGYKPPLKRIKCMTGYWSLQGGKSRTITVANFVAEAEEAMGAGGNQPTDDKADAGVREEVPQALSSTLQF